MHFTFADHPAISSNLFSKLQINQDQRDRLVQGTHLQNMIYSYLHIAVRNRRAVVTVTNVKGKGKAVPLQAWSGLEGSRKLRFPEFMTTAQDVGKVVSLTHRPPLPPRNTSRTHFR